jgi:hypothetical protein
LDKDVRAAVEQSDALIIGVLYSQRGLCKYRLNDAEGAENDWKTAEKLGGLDKDFVKEVKNELTDEEVDALVTEFAKELNQKAQREFALKENKRMRANMALKNYISETLNYVEETLREYNERKMEEARLRIEEENQKKLEAAEAWKRQEEER